MSKKLMARQNDVFQNVNGKDIKLTINNHESKKTCAEFIIEEIRNEKVKKNIVIISLLSVFSVVAYCENLFHHNFLIMLFILICCIALQTVMKVQSERLLVIKSLGLQFSVTYHLGFHSTMFVPWEDIQKVFINEVITLQRVLFFLTIMTQDSNNSHLIPLFMHMKPRLKCLEIIYGQMEEIFRQ